jgi:hypothetical protein
MARRSTAPSLWLPGFDPDDPEPPILYRKPGNPHRRSDGGSQPWQNAIKIAADRDT